MKTLEDASDKEDDRSEYDIDRIITVSKIGNTGDSASMKVTSMDNVT